jgi:hypothetical protein
MDPARPQTWHRCGKWIRHDRRPGTNAGKWIRYDREPGMTANPARPLPTFRRKKSRRIIQLYATGPFSWPRTLILSCLRI